jgi:hypothetical protein
MILHWSCYYLERGNGKSASKILSEIERYYVNPSLTFDDRTRAYRKTYNVLSYTNASNIGEMSVECSIEETARNYSVHYHNTYSGEKLDLLFNCNNDKYLSLNSDWQIKTLNDSGGLYKGLNSTGRIKREKSCTTINMLVNNQIEFPIGSIPDNIPLTCNWTLFDTIPLMDAKGDFKCVDSFAVLEDLEKLKDGKQIKFIEDWNIPSIEKDFKVKVYMLSGKGDIPSYFWVDKYHNVILASNLLSIFVLKEFSYKGVDNNEQA